MYFVQKPGTIPEDVTTSMSGAATGQLVMASPGKEGLSRWANLVLTTGGYLRYYILGKGTAIRSINLKGS